MVHVKKCALGRKRVPVQKFLKDGVPQVYCCGYRLRSEDYKISEKCMHCLDWAGGNQCHQDFEEAKREGKTMILFHDDGPKCCSE